MTKKVTTYRDAGVDIDKANRLVGSIKALNKGAVTGGTIGTLGGFSGLFKARFKRMKEPI